MGCVLCVYFLVGCVRDVCTCSATPCAQVPLHTLPPTKADLADLKAGSLGTRPRVPCGTVLVRIKSASKSKDGLTTYSRSDFEEKDWDKYGLSYDHVHDNAYAEKLYDTMRSVPTPYEKKLYDTRQSLLRRSKRNKVPAVLLVFGVSMAFDSLARAQP